VDAREAGRSPALRSAATLVGLAAVLAVFVLVRLPLLTKDASARGWNGDSAIFGLMAKKIHDGRGFDVFFWGQNYMGPLTPALAAGIRKAVLDPAGVGEEGGPISLRLASMGEIAFGICVFFLGLALLFGRPVAFAAGLWMAVGPPFFIRLSALNRSGLGPEMAFALGSVLFWLAADALTRPQPILDRPAGRFVFGLVAGIGWWMNETIAFVLVPSLVVVLWRSGPRRMRFLAPLIAGAVFGYAPVWMGRLFGWYEVHLGTVVPLWQWSGMPGRFLRFLGADAWRFVGLDGLLPAPLLAGAALLLAVFLAFRRPWPRGLAFVAAIAGIAAAVSFFKALNPLQDRYLTAALPAAVALVVVTIAEMTGALRRRIPAGLAAALPGAVALFVAVFVWRRATGTVEGLLREPDPRGPLLAIAAEGYTVCHAGYDTAYTLQFLSDERVRFVPYHSYDRNRALSAELRALPGPQCLVTDDGAVRRWLPSDAEEEGGPARRHAEKR
jgi:hypothetical protein